MKQIKDGGNSQSIWKVVKEICGNKEQNPITIIKDENDALTENYQEIANLFNSHYASVGKKLAEQIHKPPSNPLPRNTNNCSIYLDPVTEMEISDIINNLKNKKSPGIDQISGDMFKHIQIHIKTPITYLANKVIETGQFPSSLKIGIIKPIYKAGDKSEIANYRPITLITCLAKILEKVIKSRLDKFIKRHKLISDNQFGFREGKSSSDAICSLTSKIYTSLDNGKVSLAVFLDLAKAFDTVDHNQLLDTLFDLGFRGIAHDLLRSYLTNREQYVVINENISEKKIIEYGVPQGTVLGPILFTLYINSILGINSAGKILSFADDTVLFYESDSWNDLKSTVENDMQNIIDCFNQKLLTINFNKTWFVPFSCYKNKLPNFNSLNINNHGHTISINSSNHVKYLGIYIDCHMRWDFHISKSIQTLRSFLFRFRYLKNIMDVAHLKIIYHSLIESRLSYGIIGWGSAASCHLRNLDVLQKRFLKLVFGRPFLYPTDKLFKETNIMDLRQIYFLKVVMTHHKYKNNTLEPNHTYNTRSKQYNLSKTSFSSKTIGQRGYTYNSTRFYNQLPQKVRRKNSNNLFKKATKTFILEVGREIIHNIVDPNKFV